MNTTIIILIVLGAIVLIGVFLYNSLVTKRNRVTEAWSDIDTQLKKRYELIPNLVSTVKGSANFETSTLEKIVEARGKAMSAGSVAEHGQAENMITGALKSIFALSENYPDLKTSQNFLSLQADLTDIENKIQSSRRFYNGAVMDYNTAIQTVPTNIIASTFAFKESAFFELDDEAARKPVEVKF
jgi:LemA protein